MAIVSNGKIKEMIDTLAGLSTATIDLNRSIAISNGICQRSTVLAMPSHVPTWLPYRV